MWRLILHSLFSLSGHSSKCQICGLLFSSYSRMLNHKKRMHSEKDKKFQNFDFQCFHCKFKCKNAGGMNMHLLRVHGYEDYKLLDKKQNFGKLGQHKNNGSNEI